MKKRSFYYKSSVQRRALLPALLCTTIAGVATRDTSTPVMSDEQQELVYAQQDKLNASSDAPSKQNGFIASDPINLEYRFPSHDVYKGALAVEDCTHIHYGSEKENAGKQGGHAQHHSLLEKIIDRVETVMGIQPSAKKTQKQNSMIVDECTREATSVYVKGASEPNPHYTVVLTKKRKNILLNAIIQCSEVYRNGTCPGIGNFLHPLYRVETTFISRNKEDAQRTGLSYYEIRMELVNMVSGELNAICTAFSSVEKKRSMKSMIRECYTSLTSQHNKKQEYASLYKKR
jgi:hypothetical protein